MEQTFNDLCNERKQQEERGWFGFLLWMFVETASELSGTSLPNQGDETHKNMLITSVWRPSLLIILPFMIMELVNSKVFVSGKESFPFVCLLWLV
jgi:hypothetical protein